MRHNSFIYYVFFLAIVAFFSMTACNQEELRSQESAVQSTPMTFEAFFGDNMPTKTQYVDGTVEYGNTLYMNWVPGDAMNLYFNDSEADGPFVSTLTEQEGPKASSGFAGTISFATGEDAEAGGSFNDYFYAYYPYSSTNSISNGVISTSLPAEQPSVDNNVATGLLPSAARSENLRLYFYKVASVFRFMPSRGDILYVEYSGRNDEILAGDYSFSFGTDGKPIATLPTAGSKTIRLNAPDGGSFEANTWYYLVMLPQVLTQGYTLKAYTPTLVGTYTQTGSRDQTRGKYNQYKSMGTTMTWDSLPISSVTVDGEVSVNRGKTITLSATVIGSNNQDLSSYATVKWYCRDESVATVDENTGVVTGVAPGTARIYAVATNGSAEANSLDFVVTVKEGIKTITITCSDQDGKIWNNGHAQLTATVKDYDDNDITDDATVTWSLISGAGATIDESGYVTANNTAGSTTFRATVTYLGDTETADYTIMVRKISSIVVTPSTSTTSKLEVAVGNTTDVTAVAYDNEGKKIAVSATEYSSLSWSVTISGSHVQAVQNPSGNDKINSRMRFTLTGLNEGSSTLTIKATYKGITVQAGKCYVKVVAAE